MSSGHVRPERVFATTAAALLLALMAAATAAGCSGAGGEPAELLVFAAASLSDALQEIELDYETGTGSDIAISYGGSQALAQQIARGAPADLFISAGRPPMEYLTGKGAVSAEQVDLLSNELVLVVRRGHGDDMTSLAGLGEARFGRIALASPELAPAGWYAREALVRLGLWYKLEDKLVFGGDVRAALTYVTTGNADAALVYLSDARIARDVRDVVVLDLVPTESYPAIVYPASLVSASRHSDEARDFLDYLGGDRAHEVFRAHGFRPL